MQKIKLEENEYEVIKDENGFEEESIIAKYTDFFKDYDYLVGDWAYGKLRLKGFCEKENKLYKSYNDKEKIEKYIEEKCAYGCKYFILKKIK